MKKNVQNFSKVTFMLLLTFNFQLFTFNCVAQTPQSFSYQAVVRDANGNIVQNQQVSFQFSILENSATGNVVYEETQQITTNNLGLVVLAIGNGSVVQGIFSAISWGSNTHFLKVELDITGSSNYIEMGTTQLLSVPYSLYSQTAGNVQTYTAGNGISLTGNVITNTAPDQTVILNGTGATTVSGTYPNFTINSTDNNTTYSAGNAINVTGTTITNTAPDQTVNLTQGGATTITGTYPNFTISSTDNNTTYSAGTGLTLTGTTFSQDAHTGDVSGTTALTVTGIQNKPVSSTAPTSNQVLQFNGTTWTPTQPSNLINAGNGLNYSGNTLNSVWTQTGANIFNNNAGRVGIGMNAPTGKLTVQGDTSNVLFEVKDKNGYSVFVVYQDSVQVFVNASGSKTNKGSFAINPKAQSKAANTHYLRVTPDSSRIYTENPAGGFGVRDISGGTTSSYMQLTPENYFIGHEAGAHNSGGLYNSFLGYNAGYSNISGSYNIYLGNRAGYLGTASQYCTFLGYNAGQNNNSNDNTFIGYLSGSTHTMGGGNVFLGSKAGSLDSAGVRDIFIGEFAGNINKNGKDNVFIGTQAGLSNKDGYSNIFIGTYTGMNNQGSLSGYNGNFNVFLGNWAGKFNTSGFCNIFIGDDAGSNNTTGYQNVYIGRGSNGDSLSVDNTYIGNYTEMKGQGNTLLGAESGWQSKGDFNVLLGHRAGWGIHQSNKLFIENSLDTLKPLINGDFATNRFAINRIADTYPLQVGTDGTNGNGAYLTAGGTWTNTSSKTKKDRFEELNNNDLLNKIEQLDIKSWYYKGTQERHIGPVAEDFYQAFGTGVLDEPVYLGKSLAASDVAGLSLVAVKELIIMNHEQENRIDQLEKEINELKEMLKK